MNSTTLRRFLVPAILLVAGLAFLLRGQSETDRVAKTFSEVAALVSKSGAENPIAEAAKAKKFSSYVAPVLRVNVPEADMRQRAYGPQEVAQTILAIRHGSDSIHVSFEDLAIRILDAGRASATADLLCRGVSSAYGSGRDARSLHAVLVKNDDGRWVFADVTIAPIVEK